MTRRSFALALAFALGANTVAALPARGEQELGPIIVSGEAQVGGRTLARSELAFAVASERSEP